MPNLIITVTAEQATRAGAALTARYIGTALATATLQVQAADFIRATLGQLVLAYERQEKVKQAEQSLAEF